MTPNPTTTPDGDLIYLNTRNRADTPGTREHTVIAALRERAALDTEAADIIASLCARVSAADLRVYALEAELAALRAPVDTKPAIDVGGLVGRTWGSLTEAEIGALPDGTQMHRPDYPGSDKTLRDGVWLGSRGQWMAENRRHGPAYDNVITAIPKPDPKPADPTPHPLIGRRWDSLTAEERAGLPVGTVMRWDGERCCKKADGRWHSETFSGNSYINMAAGNIIESIPTEPPLPALGTRLRDLTDADLARLPVGSEFTLEAPNPRPLTKEEGGAWRFCDGSGYDTSEMMKACAVDYRVLTRIGPPK